MAASARVLIGLLDSADELENVLAEEWPAWRNRLLELLSRLDLEGETQALDADVSTLVEQLSDETAAAGIVNRIMERELTSLAPQAASSLRSLRPYAIGDELEQRSLEAPESSGPRAVVTLPVFYGTNRKREDGDGTRAVYTSQRATNLDFGVADVSIPLRHRLGRVEGPRLWRLEVSEDPARHVTIHTVEPLDREGFTGRMGGALASADERDALVFIHGYHVSFDEALRRTAQIAYDLKFPGCAVLFSWPSYGNLIGYLKDGSNAEWAFPDFRDFLNLMLTKMGARTVHVIAHSMGSRLLLDALDRFDVRALPAGSAQLGQVVFAAPDVDAETLQRTARTLPGRATRLTFYMSSNDLALRVSRLLHGHNRAGADLFVIDGIDTVDASQADTSLIGLGHSYYGSQRSILSDLCTLINSSLHPARRFDVDAATSDIGLYWVYRP
jgi:esterase/lipase superfamily enzyme